MSALPKKNTLNDVSINKAFIENAENGKKSGGRPALSEKYKRNKPITLLCTTEEINEIEKKARSKRLTRTEYIRIKLFAEG